MLLLVRGTKMPLHRVSSPAFGVLVRLATIKDETVFVDGRRPSAVAKWSVIGIKSSFAF
jgi:hypothetical protein